MQLDFVTNKGIMQMVKSYEIHTKRGADLKYAPLFALFPRKNSRLAGFLRISGRRW